MIFYFHGLGSSGEAVKANRLREYFSAREPAVEVLSPTYPAWDVREGERVLRLEVNQAIAAHPTEPLLFVGSSMGGFYARRLAGAFPGARIALINPALTPATGLAKYIGVNERIHTGEEFVITAEHVAAFGEAEEWELVPTLLLIDKGDEVLDYRVAADIYEGRAERVLFEDGCHVFDHMEEALPLIERFYWNAR